MLPELKGFLERNTIRCDVVFGSPSLGCRGTGVCKITAQQAIQPNALRRDCRSASAFLASFDGGKGVSLLLLRGMLCVNIVRNHLMHNTLEMKEPCMLPPGFVKALHLQTNIIRPGIYPVEEMNGYYRINFK